MLLVLLDQMVETRLSACIEKVMVGDDLRRLTAEERLGKHGLPL